MTRLFSLLLFLTLIIGAYLSLAPRGGSSTAPVQGFPWQIELLPDGYTKVFGIRPGADTLEQARAQLGPDPQLAIISTGAEDYSLEMYYDRYTAGVLSGKLVLTGQLPADQLMQMAARSTRTTHLKTGARKLRLHADDLPRAWQAPVQAIAFIPTARLNQPTAIQHFGTPAETIVDGQKTHLLYPDKGLDLMLDENGKSVLQYVAPREFYRLRDPLQGQAESAGVKTTALPSGYAANAANPTYPLPVNYPATNNRRRSG
ncbi:MAG TPA: hypothetical protein ENK49_01780 [Gammaproteobacteria bacterium]|nr:hypothetical protein [Gammaproteobacteria bacterium]